MQVAPGVSTDANPNNPTQNTITVYGSSGAENAYYIDGVNTTNAEYGFQGKELNFEFIQEVDVKTGGYQAEYGRATGGIINVITKSGGNDFTGDVFGYYDADSLQANTKPVVSTNGTVKSFTRKDYGADLGGAILRDKLWFFAAYDRVPGSIDRTLPGDETTVVRSPSRSNLGAAKLKAWIGDAAEATVRRVANHTSGLPLHWHFFYEDETCQRPPMDETIRRYGNLVTPPGEKHQYSNLGYGILDYMIFRLSGKSYPHFMRQEVFLPLGMTRASVDIGPGLEPHAAARYGSDGWRIPFYDFDHPGGSAVFCSAHDLVRFGMFHLKAHLPDQKAILSDAALDEMQTPTSTTGKSSGHGVGWSVNEDKLGYRGIGHGGGMGGVCTALEIIPSQKLVVVALANSNTDLPWVVAEEIFSLLLPGYRERRAERQAKEQAEKEEKERAGKTTPGFTPPASTGRPPALPSPSAMVWVLPPLSASAPSTGSPLEPGQPDAAGEPRGNRIGECRE